MKTFPRGTPDPRKRKKSPSVAFYSGLAVAAVVVLLLLYYYMGSSSGNVVKKATKSSGFSVVKREDEFDSPLWQADVLSGVQKKPYLYFDADMLVKSFSVLGDEYRVLAFDTSGEVQGAIVFKNGVPDWKNIVLEYIRAMRFSMFFFPKFSCNYPLRVLSLGLGAGTMANIVHHNLPNSIVDVVEIDPKIYKVAKDYLGTPESDPRFNVFIGDALNVFDFVDPNVKYDIIFHDAYRPGPEIPPSLTEPAYLKSLASRLSDSGILILNFCLPFYSEPKQLKVIEQFRTAFRHMHMIEATPTSKIVVMYNWDRQQPDGVEERREQAMKECAWPAEARGREYQLYLDTDEAFLRPLHQEVTRAACASGAVSGPYCNWFRSRDVVAVAAGLTFGSKDGEAIIAKAGGKLEKARQLAQQFQRGVKE